MFKHDRGNQRRVISALLTVCLTIFQTGHGLADDGWRLSGRLRTNETILRIWDAGLYPAETFKPFFWVDNSTLLIAANNGPKPKTMEGMRARQTWLYLWTLGNKPRPLGVDPHEASTTYCAADGQVSYHQKVDTTTRTRWVGPPGQEKQAPPWNSPAPGAPNNRNSIERIDCEQFADPTMVGQSYVTDSERRHYLVFGESLRGLLADEKLVLMRADKSNKITLPIYRDENPNVQYQIFEKVFYAFESILSDNSSGGYPSSVTPFHVWKEKNCWPFWRISPDTANVERLCIPYGPWVGETQLPEESGATISLVPTKAGLFFVYARRKGKSGLFSLRNGIVRYIAAGGIHYPVVSPNGCRVAFYYFPNERAPRLFGTDTSNLAAIDVCSVE